MVTKVKNINLSRFRVVVVTGPQRSGTTIAARIIAHDSDMTYVDEDDYGTKNVEEWKTLVGKGQGIVIHSPAVSRWVHEIEQDGVAVVWMKRPLADVLNSQARINWDDANERANYDMEPDDARPVAAVKNDYWHNNQAWRIRFSIEILYESLAGHPLWVEPEKRTNFGPRQWQENEYGLEIE